ncbi:SgcJ/EcaC family oxidoreductase [Nitrospirillum sp. BR 11164]|uniref:YybH family protein n=1 Tax=Nitrospirillum sp. BR 11164 TaxID=3104324 RepID=UPI002AFE8B16|nr:SgcJ/EcaC family oxidoreductase [Nitrospirillum sp. BR 11164]MEA1652726.1 SgcJ/EcaC family oxidoreductase [Nitrospirillum sp. BR 11164]
MEEEVKSVLEAYRQAVWDRKPEALLALYTEDVVVFDTWDSWSYAGRSEWAQSVEAWLGGLSDERVRVTAEAVRVVGGGGAAGLSAFLTYTALSPEGAKLRSMQNRLSWQLVKHENQWRIAQEHTSVPIAPESLMGHLSRESDQDGPTLRE